MNEDQKRLYRFQQKKDMVGVMMGDESSTKLFKGKSVVWINKENGFDIFGEYFAMTLKKVDLDHVLTSLLP